jgi:hypothetical protein
MRALRLALLGCGLVAAGGLAALGQGGNPATRSNNWLLETNDNEERFRRLQIYLRGFDQPMWEVGARYEALYAALGDANYDLARYHWDKIRVTIETGHMKRPARRANAEGMFLNTIWAEVDRDFATRRPETAWAAFALARETCMACHVAERVAFMNDQPMFRQTATPPVR